MKQLYFLLFSFISFAQTPTVGVLQYDSTNTYEGYTLFTPERNGKTFLIFAHRET